MTGRPRVTLGLLAILLVTPLPAGVAATVQTDQAPPPTLPWWGPDDFQTGWNIRVPVTVESGLAGSVQNLPATVEIDLGHAVQAAGWPTTDVGGREVLESFKLDPSSIRIVEYTNFRLPRVAANDAQQIAADEDLPDPERYTLPTQVIEGAWDRPQKAPFDPAANPVLTLRWIMPGATQPDEPRHFVVYLDVTQNGDKAPQDTDRLQDSLLGGLDWIGRGTTVAGVGEQVVVTAQTPGTQVTVHRFNGRNPVPHQSTTLTGANTFGLGTTPVPWLVTADAPVLATSQASRTSGFYPSWDGTLLGTQWNLPIPTPSTGNDLYVYNPNDRPVRVSTNQASGMIVQPGGITVDGGASQSPLTVSSTGPVLVQGQTAGLLPSPFVGANGAPADTEMFGTVIRTNTAGTRIVELLNAVNLGPGEASATLLNATSRERLVPIPSAGSTETVAEVPTWPTWRSFQPAADARGPTELHVMDPQDPTQPANDPRVVAFGGQARRGVMAPLGGVGAMEFSAPMPVRVVAFHNATSVTVLPEEGPPSGLGLDRFQQAPAAASFDNPVRIQASKPVAVLPDGPMGYGAGHLEARHVEAGSAQYRGYLVSLDPGGDETEPMARSISFGANTSFELTVRNLAQDTRGEPIPDTAELSVPVSPPGWNATVTPARVPLGPGGEATVTLEVKAPETRGSGDRVVLPVQAASASNPNMTDQVTTVTLLREQRGVGLWFDSEDGPTQLTTNFRPGETRELPVVVKNQGSSKDTLRLSVANADSGWSSRFIDNGTTLRSIELAPGQAERLTLETTAPPPGSLLIPKSLVLQATSTNDTTVAAKAVLDALVAADSELMLTTDQALRVARPGDEVAFQLQLHNRGSTAADVQLNASGDLPSTWDRPEFHFRGQSLAGVGDRLNSVQPTSREGIPLQLVLNVPDDAPGGLSTAVLTSATAAGLGGGQPDLLPLNVFVEPFTELTHDPVPPVTVQPGANVSTSVHVLNDGNAPADLAVERLSVPSGWSVTSASNLTVEPGDEATLPVTVSVPPGTPAGQRSLRLGLFGEEGKRVVDLPVQVPEVATLNARGPANATLPSGVGTTLTVELTNTGNAPATPRLEADAPDGWQASIEPGQPRIEPLATRVLKLTVQPALDAAGQGRLVLRDAEEPSATPLLDVDVVAEQAALSLQRAGIAPDSAPGQTTVRGVVLNQANLTLENVTVALLDGDEERTRTQLDRVPAHTPRPVVVTTETTEVAGDLRLVVDPDDRFPEADETDNAMPVTADAGQDTTPVRSWAILLGVLGAALVARRRRR